MKPKKYILIIHVNSEGESPVALIPYSQETANQIITDTLPPYYRNYTIIIPDELEKLIGKPTTVIEFLRKHLPQYKKLLETL